MENQSSRFRSFLARKQIEISLKRYFVDAMGAMAFGLFASLLIGTIFDAIADQTGWAFLAQASEFCSAATGPAMAVAIGYALQAPSLVLFCLCAVGAAANSLGGPLGTLFAAIVAAELGKAVSKETKVDILVTPTVTILFGCAVAALVGPGVSAIMYGFGALVMRATEMHRKPRPGQGAGQFLLGVGPLDVAFGKSPVSAIPFPLEKGEPHLQQPAFPIEGIVPNIGAIRFRLGKGVVSQDGFQFISRGYVKQQPAPGTEPPVGRGEKRFHILQVIQVIHPVAGAYDPLAGPVQLEPGHILADEGNPQACLPGLGSGLLQHFRGNIHPDHGKPLPGQPDGDGAGAASAIHDHAAWGQKRRQVSRPTIIVHILHQGII